MELWEQLHRFFKSKTKGEQPNAEKENLDLIGVDMPQKVLSSDLLTARQLADLLQCSRHTVYAWVCKNQLPIPYYKFPRGVRFKRSDVDKWLESRKIMPVNSL